MNISKVFLSIMKDNEVEYLQEKMKAKHHAFASLHF